MKITKHELTSMIREALVNAQEAIGYDGMEEPKEIRKARLMGRTQAREKFSGKSPQELQAIYLKIEEQAERELDPVKNTILWGALDQIKGMLRKVGYPLPRKSQDPWTR